MATLLLGAFKGYVKGFLVKFLVFIWGLPGPPAPPTPPNPPGGPGDQNVGRAGGAHILIPVDPGGGLGGAGRGGWGEAFIRVHVLSQLTSDSRFALICRLK